MTEIHGSADCGNSPKNRFVQSFAIALETGQMMPEDLSDDVIWNRPEARPVSGRDAVLAILAGHEPPVAVRIDHAISHGKIGAASGETTLKDGQRRRFCHVLEFTTAKGVCVAVIASYR